MNLEDAKTIMSKMILKAGEAMIQDKKDALTFVKLIESKDFQNAYKMLSLPIKEQLSIEDFHKITNPEVVVTQQGYYEGPTIYKYIALQFAEHLVQKKYQDAYKLLSPELKKEYSPEKLKEKVTRMVNYFHTNKLTVYIDFVIAEGDAGYENNIYVPIEEEGNQEAVCVDVDYENTSLCIKSIEWGRP
ncbi:MAG TPA: hypothetical protein ENK91_10235 [Bacteroidetes bacterium]|nr:hypothetical protein [Arcobacter sp.]HHH54026.1 hypothetical protein [Bacteroidota bacterium]